MTYRKLLALIPLLAVVASSAPLSFNEEFSSPVLDPAWTVQPGVGAYSLASVPGSLQYQLTSTTFPGDGNALWIHRPFDGTQWTLNAFGSYTFPGGTGRQLYVRVLFGDLTAKDVNDAIFYHDFDFPADRKKIVGSFSDVGWLGGEVAGFGGDPARWFANSSTPPSSWYFRFTRDGQEIAIQTSLDGLVFSDLVRRTFTTPLDPTQILLISGASFSSEGGTASYDYFRLQSDAIPEPATWTIVAGGLGLLVLRCRARS